MSDLNLAKLREIAEAATPDEWKASSVRAHPDADGLRRGSSVVRSESYGIIFMASSGPHAGSDATHIATFDPPTVLALIDEVETLRRIRADLTDIAVENNPNAGPYTPTTERILGWLREGMGEYADVMEGWFARWLKHHDREVAAKAWDEVERLRGQLDSVRGILERSPECHKYPAESTPQCGWKSDLNAIRETLNGGGSDE